MFVNILSLNNAYDAGRFRSRLSGEEGQFEVSRVYLVEKKTEARGAPLTSSTASGGTSKPRSHWFWEEAVQAAARGWTTG